MNKEFEGVLEDINRSLRGSGWERIRSNQSAEWFGCFVSAVVLAVGHRMIEHIDSGVTFEGGDAFAAKVVVFTERTVVFADAAGTSHESPEMLVIARPRSGLVQLSIAGGASAYAQDGFETWPGNFTVTAMWEHGAVATFPIGSMEFEEQRGRFMALYSALSTDLGK